MEDGVKEEPAQSKEPRFLGKAGWVKKAPGRLLASYKDRYIHVEKTEMVVYENEDLHNCLERLDLENYEKCHELKSPFKKKHRLILIRSPKSGNKVQDVKFQAQTSEEKEAWIKALSDGVCRAKNKVLDEVKIDEDSNLEHVTRTRPKGNRNRRPPTRIHMKEVADVSSDGILRLDLDLEDAFMPNGTHHASVDGPDRETPSPLSVSQEEAHTEPEASPQKKFFKPPMPPTKEAKNTATPDDQPHTDDVPEKKVLKPPMPPSKETKPCVSPLEEAIEGEAMSEKMSDKSPDAQKKTCPPPTPPNKPSSSSSSMGSPTESSNPPTPPLKHKKASSPAGEPDPEPQGKTDDNNEKGEDKKKEEAPGTAEWSVCKDALLIVRDGEPERASAEGQGCEEESRESKSSDNNKAPSTELPTPPEPLRKCPSPLLTPMNKPHMQHIEDPTTIIQSNEEQDPTASLKTASNTSAGLPHAEEAPPRSEVPSVLVSLNEPVPDSLSPFICHKQERTEEKSVDSGQHSDDDSQGSGSEDTLAASSAVLRGSHPGLDVLDASEEHIHISACSRPTQAAPKPQVTPRLCPAPTPSIKPSTKARSASFGDLLCDPSACVRVGPLTHRAPADDVMKLEAEVALEMEKTSELLNRVSQAQGGGDGQSEDLLAKAMEKLKKADYVLREVNKLKTAKNSSDRKSW